MENVMRKIRSLDAYPKINEDYYSRTLSGAVITLASFVVMLLLLNSELSVYTISGISDSFIYHGQKAIKKKMEIGKLN